MAGGEYEERSNKKRFTLQTKLKVNEPGDIYEQEADQIADQVLAAPTHAGISGTPPPIQRFSGESTGQMNGAPASVDYALASPGMPLAPALRQDMEQRFGHDFSRVRVHTGASAERSAQDVDAHAYTVGNNMVFGASQYAPGTQEGRLLIAHELTHVVQQQTSQVSIQRQPARRVPVLLPDPIAELNDQIRIVGETILPYEIWHRLENVALTKSDEDNMLFKRKLEAIVKLGDLRDERAVMTLVAVLEDSIFAIKRLDPQKKLILQQEAAESLGKIGGTVALSKLNDLLNSKDPKERLMASRGFSGAAGGQAVADLLAALKKETDAGIKSQIIFALGNIGSGSSSNQEKELIVKELIREMENSTGAVQLAAINALGRIKLKSATEALLKQLKQHLSIAALVQDIIRALGEIGDDRAVELLVIMLEKHGSKFVRSAAAIALGKIRGSKALAALKSRLSQEIEDSVKADISTAIQGP